MGRQCVNCGYERQATDFAPPDECPNCGAVYAKVEATVQKEQEQAGLARNRAQDQQAVRGFSLGSSGSGGAVRGPDAHPETHWQAQDVTEGSITRTEQRLQPDTGRTWRQSTSGASTTSAVVYQNPVGRFLSNAVIAILYAVAVLALIGGLSLAAQYWPPAEIVVAGGRSVPTPPAAYLASYVWLGLGITQFALLSGIALAIHYLRHIRDALR